MGDLFDWALRLAAGDHVWNDSVPLAWDDEVARFHETLHRFDARLAGDEPLRCTSEQLFQGPVADALTHVGQLAMLRRLAGVQMRGENYFKARMPQDTPGSSRRRPSGSSTRRALIPRAER